LLARDGATALLEACDAQAVVLFVRAANGQVQLIGTAGCDAEGGRALAATAQRGSAGSPPLLIEPIGRTSTGGRFVALSASRPLAGPALQRFRTLCAVLRQGFELCQARDRQPETSPGAFERPLEPLLPGFVCASAAMQRVAEQIPRMQGNDLPVLITGESGTGKDLVARAIHAPSREHVSSYNCTSATRELADSQLFGHRRGVLRGDRGSGRCASDGGWRTLFLDEVGDMSQSTQAKILRVLQEHEFERLGGTRTLRVDVRIIAATNRNLTQMVQEGKFREDLFYRLSVIRIHVPPLRERREDIPHLSTFFLREASERLGKPGVRLTAETLDIFDAFPGPACASCATRHARRPWCRRTGRFLRIALSGVWSGTRRWRMASDREAGERRSPPRSDRTRDDSVRSSEPRAISRRPRDCLASRDGGST
jgi:DNA-binding NtrC family response regulator